MNRALLLAIAAAALVAMAPRTGVLNRPQAETNDKTPWVLTDTPERKTVSRILVLPGEIRANQEVVLERFRSEQGETLARCEGEGHGQRGQADSDLQQRVDANRIAAAVDAATHQKAAEREPRHVRCQHAGCR